LFFLEKKITKGVFELSQNLNSVREKRPSKNQDNINQIQRNEKRFVWSSLFKKEIIKTESHRSELLDGVQNNITTGATSNIIQVNSSVIESPNQVSYLDLIKGE
jgi:hypothetical protein